MEVFAGRNREVTSCARNEDRRLIALRGERDYRGCFSTGGVKLPQRSRLEVVKLPQRSRLEVEIGKNPQVG